MESESKILITDAEPETAGEPLLEADDRIVYGIRCTWWDSIDKIGFKPAAKRDEDQTPKPCCARCGGPIAVLPLYNWQQAMIKAENLHAGYAEFLSWCRSRCYRSYEEAAEYYTKLTGCQVETDVPGALPEDSHDAIPG